MTIEKFMGSILLISNTLDITIFALEISAIRFIDFEVEKPAFPFECEAPCI